MYFVYYLDTTLVNSNYTELRMSIHDSEEVEPTTDIIPKHLLASKSRKSVCDYVLENMDNPPYKIENFRKRLQNELEYITKFPHMYIAIEQMYISYIDDK